MALVLSVGVATDATAGRGPGNDGGCNEQSTSENCTPDRGDECSNGQHTGNPHCQPEAAPTTVPTVVVIPTETPSEPDCNCEEVAPTPTPRPVIVVIDTAPVVTAAPQAGTYVDTTRSVGLPPIVTATPTPEVTEDTGTPVYYGGVKIPQPPHTGNAGLR